jgi:hypothetical protein
MSTVAPRSMAACIVYLGVTKPDELKELYYKTATGEFKGFHDLSEGGWGMHGIMIINILAAFGLLKIHRFILTLLEFFIIVFYTYVPLLTRGLYLKISPSHSLYVVLLTASVTLCHEHVGQGLSGIRTSTSTRCRLKP